MSSPRANSHGTCVRAGQKQSAFKRLTAAVLIYLTALTPLSSFGAEPMFSGPAIGYSSSRAALGERRPGIRPAASTTASGKTAFSETALANHHKDSQTLVAALVPQESSAAGSAAVSTNSGITASTNIFGPTKYLRTEGPPNDYVTTVNVPAWVASPFDLHIQNGAADGCYRVSSAWIYINGTQVASPSDFNQNVFVIDRAVTLTATTTLEVKLASKPGSYLTINLLGTNADHTAPQITVTSPMPGSTISTTTPHLAVQYTDLVGAGEPAASGVNTATLKVTLDGVDRTSLFTKRSGDATADLPPSLALTQGAHTLAASVQDYAGNTGQTSAQFTVSLQAPQLQIIQPATGTFINTNVPSIRIQYQGPNLDLSTFQVLINGVDRSGLFSKGANEADATLTASTALLNGANQIVANLKNLAGTQGMASSSFNVDTIAPVITINQPANGSHAGVSSVGVNVSYSDDQALDLTTFQASLDGNPLTLSIAPAAATGTLTGLPDGNHTITTSIKDKAGHSTTATSNFSVDTAIPVIHITVPVDGSFVATLSPHVNVTYSDPDLALSTLKITSNGHDITSLFTVGPSSASADLTGAASVGQGANTLTAQISDLSGHTGNASSSFTVDTILPSGSITSPPAITNSATPSLQATYSDSGSGIDLTSVHVFVDGQEVTSQLAVGPGSVSGVAPALQDGSHQLLVKFSDRAGNPNQVSENFLVDTIAPTASFISPSDNSFLNNPKPNLQLNYTDGNGSGVDPASVHVFLQAGTGPVTEITSYFTIGAQSAVGIVPAPLADGTYHLSAQLKDRAGNSSLPVQSSFEIDTVPPSYSVDAPIGFVRSTTPVITIRYQDDRSGVDTSRFVFQIDGVDFTSRLTFTSTGATGTLQAADALTQGAHQVSVTVYDRAGNAAPMQPQTFTVDSIPPVITLQSPLDGAFIGSSQPAVSFSYSDTNGTGVDTTAVHVLVDGVEVTANFQIGPTAAQGTLTAPLADGQHSLLIKVADLAGNTTPNTTGFFVDSHAPVLTITSPKDGIYQRQLSVLVTGTVQDVDPQTTVQCVLGAISIPAVLTLQSGQPTAYSCTVSLTEGPNPIQVIAKNRAGLQSTATVHVILDTIPPQVTIAQPPDGSYSNQQVIAVSGAVTDASPVTVQVQGVGATINGNQFTASVLLPSEGLQALQAVATDTAGNVGQASVNLHVDRTNPVVKISSPAVGAYIKGPVITVNGTVTDASPTMTDVNGNPVILGANGAFSTQIPVVDGPLNIIASSHDAAGNVGTDQVPVVIDTVPPLITIASPADGLITNQATLVIQGTTTDASPVTLTLNGNPVPVSNGNFSQSVTMSADGANTFTLVATDAAGNTSTQLLHVTLDRTPPDLSIAAPSPGAVLGSLPVVVQGLVQDDTATTVTVNGMPATVTQNAWQLSVSSLPEGS